MKIAVAADHGGFLLKEAVKKAMLEQGFEIVDLGTHSEESVDYPEYGHKCAEYVISGQADKGLVFCGSGIGIGIAANKTKGIRCAMPACDEHAMLAAAHNDANMLSFGGRFTDSETALRHIGIWLSTPPETGRHERRRQELDAL